MKTGNAILSAFFWFMCFHVPFLVVFIVGIENLGGENFLWSEYFYVLLSISILFLVLGILSLWFGSEIRLRLKKKPKPSKPRYIVDEKTDIEDIILDKDEDGESDIDDVFTKKGHNHFQKEIDKFLEDMK